MLWHGKFSSKFLKIPHLNPFLLNCFWSSCFVAPIETITKTYNGIFFSEEILTNIYLFQIGRAWDTEIKKKFYLNVASWTNEFYWGNLEQYRQFLGGYITEERFALPQQLLNVYILEERYGSLSHFPWQSLTAHKYLGGGGAGVDLWEAIPRWIFNESRFSSGNQSCWQFKKTMSMSYAEDGIQQ